MMTTNTDNYGMCMICGEIVAAEEGEGRFTTVCDGCEEHLQTRTAFVGVDTEQADMKDMSIQPGGCTVLTGHVMLLPNLVCMLVFPGNDFETINFVPQTTIDMLFAIHDHSKEFPLIDTEGGSTFRWMARDD